VLDLLNFSLLLVLGSIPLGPCDFYRRERDGPGRRGSRWEHEKNEGATARGATWRARRGVAAYKWRQRPSGSAAGACMTRRRARLRAATRDGGGCSRLLLPPRPSMTTP
jgi:hypothetical protein